MTQGLEAMIAKKQRKKRQYVKLQDKEHYGALRAWLAQAGSALRTARKAHGLSTQDVADAVGSTAGAVSVMERGGSAVTLPSLAQLFGVAQFLGVRLVFPGNPVKAGNIAAEQSKPAGGNGSLSADQKMKLKFLDNRPDLLRAFVKTEIEELRKLL